MRPIGRIVCFVMALAGVPNGERNNEPPAMPVSLRFAVNLCRFEVICQFINSISKTYAIIKRITYFRKLYT